MPRRRERWIITLALLCTCALALPASAADVHPKTGENFGQYHTGKQGYDTAVTILNPSRVAMVTAIIGRKPDGTGALNGDTSDDDNGPCVVCEVPRKGTDMHCFEDLQSDWGNSPIQVLSVTRNGGKFNKRGTASFGVVFVGKLNRAYAHATDPKLFRLGASEAPAVQECICKELSDRSLPGNLFAKVPGLSACS